MSETGDSGEARAIPFITQQESGALAIEAEAAAFLRSVEGPLCVVAIVGMHRTGKSYLMNTLLVEQHQQRQQRTGSCGFKVGKGLSTCTKGVWIFNQVVEIARPDGSTARLLLLDTQGTGSADGDEQSDVLTWALTLMLSSYLIYNSVGSIDEHSISQLSLVTHVTSLLRTTEPSDSSSRDTTTGGYELFPSFLWLLRDFSLELVTPTGEPITSDQYLERALQPVESTQPEFESKNSTRKTLRECFRSLHCYTLVRPAIDEDVLQQLGETDVTHTRKHFQQQLRSLRLQVARDCGLKRIRGAPVGGMALLALSESFVAAVTGAGSPVSSLADAYSEAAKAMAQHALSTARQKLLAAVRPASGAQQPLCETALDSYVGDAARAARRLLLRLLGFSADALAQEALDKLELDIAAETRRFRADNDARSERLLERLYQHVSAGILQARYASLPQFLADHARTRSCAAEQVGRAQAAEFFERRIVDGVTKMLSEKEALVEAQKGDMQQLQRQLRASDEALAACQTRAEGEASRAREQIAHLSTQLEEGEHQHSLRASKFAREVERLEAQCAQLAQQEAEFARSLDTHRQQLAQQEAEFTRSLDTHRQQFAQQEAEFARSSQQHAGLLDVNQQALARAQAQVTQLRQDVERLESRCSELDMERESTQRQLADAAAQAASTALALQAARQRAAELERSAQEAAAAQQHVELETRRELERARAAREQAEALAEAERATLHVEVRQLSERVAELKEDKASLQSTLSEYVGRTGDASLVSESHWKERLGQAEAAARRKVEEVQSANEAAVAALTRAFESERHALALRVASLERQEADAAAELEQRRAEQTSMASEYDAAIDELERELAHAREMMGALGQNADVASKMEALSHEVGKGRDHVGAALAALSSKANKNNNNGAPARQGEEINKDTVVASMSRILAAKEAEDTVVASMSRILAAKEAEVEDMREATDGTVVRLRALIEHKDTETARLQRSLKIFLNHCIKAQCRYCGREFEARCIIEHVPVCMSVKGISGYQLLVDTPPCVEWAVEVQGTHARLCDGHLKTVYLISARRGETSVCVSRRYSDIRRLHSQLKTRLPRVKLADFKPLHGHAGSLFAASEDLVVKRQHQIAAYLRALLHLPIVANTPEMTAFLRSESESESEKNPSSESSIKVEGGWEIETGPVMASLRS